MMRHRHRLGFTLLEVILVVFLFGLLVMIALPSLDTTSTSNQLEESVRRMQSLVALCRASAMNDSLTYRVTFERDGIVSLQRQLDPLLAPNQFVDVPPNWFNMDIVLPNVWVSEVQPLPDGPAPIIVEDDEINFDPNLVVEPTPIDQFETSPTLDFEPDGSCPSFRWILRDKSGRGVMMTLDGRLGRIAIETQTILENPVRPQSTKEVQAERTKRAADSEKARLTLLQNGSTQ